MCGIVGYYGLRLLTDEAQAMLRRMCDTIIYRGPDDEGYCADDAVGLGMRRLSIIDLVHGHQPMSNEDGSLVIVFNGEIYNYRDLRADLISKGRRFITESDTEVILRQYEQDGAACVRKFNGMFAFAVWDRNRRALFLARDRMGVKPLYYCWNGKTMLFASEIKALLATDLVPRRMNRRALWDYLTFRYVPQPETIWENVYKLPPGHTLLVSEEHPAPMVSRYWDIPYDEIERNYGAGEMEEEFTGLFLDAVRLRLIADVPVGILLSGGLDSSAVAAATAGLHNARMGSFSVAFSESPQIDELPFARQMAQHVGTDHNEIVIGQKEVCEFLPNLVHYTDEPLADLAAIPLYYVSHLAREKVKVVLSGEGCDEILAGYDFDRFMKDVDRRRAWQRLPGWLHSGAGTALLRQLLGAGFKQRFHVDETPLDLRCHPVPPHMTNYFSSDEKRAMLLTDDDFGDSMDVVRKAIGRVPGAEPLHQVLYAYCQSWLVEDLLMKADRMSMANSLELRTPFLDYRLVEWAARAPARAKVGKNAKDNYETKYILRRFAEKRLPPEIINRPKMGFPVPLYDWLPNRLKGWAEDLLLSSDTHIFRWFKRDAVQLQLRLGTEITGELLDRHRLWNLLIFELWCREWNPV